MAVLPVVLSAVLLFSDRAQQGASNDSERSHSIREAEVGLDKMTRELRQAHTLISVGAYKVEFRGGLLDKHVVHDCSEPHPTEVTLMRCVRFEVAANGVQTIRETLIDRLANQQPGSPSTPVFSYTPSSLLAKHVRLKIEVNARGARQEGYRYRVVLDDGVNLRNRDLEN